MEKERMKPEDMDQEFLEFLNRHQGVLRRMCRVYAHSAEDREDLFQEMVYQLWKSYPTFRRESSQGTWLYRVALNTAISALRRKTKTDKHVALETDMAEVPSPDAKGRESGQIELLYRMIRRLNKVDRALVLLYLEDLSYKELGSILGLSESNVGVKLTRIKARLQSFAKELE
jgi:RNA polymerase sigma-70 factor, ECF subfamily